MSDFAWSPLLADADIFLHLGDRFRQGGSQFGWQSVGIVAGIVLAVVVIVWALMRWLHHRERQVSNSPQRLLVELCTAHGLNYRQRQLVQRLARQHRLAHPAMLFIEPALWDAKLLGPWWGMYEGEIRRMRDKLFARSPQ